MVNTGLFVDRVSVSYGEAPRGRPAELALDGVTLRVAHGEVVALLGPSGCGKSTLLRAISGLEPVRSGRVLWDGSEITQLAPHVRGIGVVFQDAQLFSHMSVEKNVTYGLRGAAWPKAARAERARELLELVGLPDAGSRAVTQLSGGERQRVALARSLAPSPRVLLLDEPLSALDRGLRDRLASELAALLRVTATTAVFVTHDSGEAQVIADRTVRMRAGKLDAESGLTDRDEAGA